MAEAEAIVGIHGAVDRAVQEDTAARLRVAEVLPGYLDPKLRWYDDFLDWLGQTAKPSHPAPAYPDLAGSLNHLAEEDEGIPARMGARRMFAIALAGRAFPELADRRSDLYAAAVAALNPLPSSEPEIVRESGSVADRAERLYALLAGVKPPEPPVLEGSSAALEGGPPGSAPPAGGPPGGGWWDKTVHTALASKLIASPVGMFPRPCAGRLVNVPGGKGPAAVLTTELETDAIDFKTACRFIEPANWKKCMPSFWRTMRVTAKLPGGQRVYREVVSTDGAEQTNSGFWAKTDLLFNFMWVPDEKNPQAAVANYRFAEGRPKPNDRIQVDEGTLVVARVKPPEGNGSASESGDEGKGAPGGAEKREKARETLRITTTKRVQFNYPFSSEALAMVVCALGYADVSGELLACAATHGRLLEGGSNFPGVSAIAGANKKGTKKSKKSKQKGGAPAGGTQGEGGQGPIEEMADVWARAARDGARALERSFGEAARRGTGKHRRRS